jgi:hypothetical protein
MRKLKMALVAVAIGLSVLGFQVPAQAATNLGGVSVEAACDNQRGAATTARLMRHDVHGWFCALYIGGGVHYYDVNLSQECRRVHGSSAYAAYLNYNDPYSWRCYR